VSRPTSGGDSDLDAMRRVAQAGRRAVREVWARREVREQLDPPARRLLELLEAHKEYRAYWEGAEPGADENPFLHVSYHQVLNDQLDSGEPPEAAEAVERLEGQGLGDHEAQHEVMRVLIRELLDMVNRRGPFDAERYREHLRQLGQLPA